MNRVFLFIVLLGFLGCDTAQNIDPLGEDYFIKFYGALGDQEGISVKSTPDGGFIIGGNSIVTLGGSSDYLLIKVDALGNQEWMRTYDFDFDDVFTDVIVEANGYVMAGTSDDINGIKKVKLIRTDSDGVNVGEYIVREAFNDNYICNGFSSTSAGDFIIVGPRFDSTIVAPNGRSFIGIVDNIFSDETLHFEGDTILSNDNNIEFKIGIEVMNHDDNRVNYLAFGDKISSTSSEFTIYQYEDDFREINTSEASSLTDARSVDVAKIDEFKYLTLITTGDISFLVLVSENSEGHFVPKQGQLIKMDGNLRGSNLSISKSNQVLISGDIIEEGSAVTSSTILEASSFGTINWQRVFGTEFSYKSGKVITLIDGSVVFVGTAGFKEQSKVFLIKLKSNGDMK